jgi:hypothetical protein
MKLQGNCTTLMIMSSIPWRMMERLVSHRRNITNERPRSEMVPLQGTARASIILSIKHIQVPGRLTSCGSRLHVVVFQNMLKWDAGSVKACISVFDL